MSEHPACKSYRRGNDVCADGFVQKPICSGRAGCHSCGHLSDATAPHCQNEDIPARWLTDSGLPLFYAPSGAQQ